MGVTKGSDMTERLNNNNSQVLAVACRTFSLHYGMQDLFTHQRSNLSLCIGSAES